MNDNITRKAVADAVFDATEEIIGREVELHETYTDLGIDSLDWVEICMEVEKTLGCKELTEAFDSFDAYHNITIEELIDNICNFLEI